jgi:phosphohistidine swiveling domain-containing protein
MSETVAPGQPIPVPDDFPVTWEHPDDAKLAWTPGGHNTNPKSPLSHAVTAAGLRGFNPALTAYGLPIQFRTANFNGFSYSAAVPTAAPPEAVVKTIATVSRFAPGLVKLLTGRMSAGLTKRQLEALTPVLDRLEGHWREDLLPEINRHFAYFETSDLRGMSQAQLRAHFAEGLERVEKLGELHARAGFPAIVAMSMFEELYLELFPGATSLDALRLIGGFDSETLEGDRVLWSLSRVVLDVPEVQRVLVERPAAEVVPALEGFVEGRRFLAELRAYLNRYGQRLNYFGELTEPSWAEDPTSAVECLKAYVLQPDADPDAERAWLMAEREKAMAEARAGLVGYPEPVKAEFETLLKAAQVGAGVKEDNHWVFERLFYYMRRIALEFGRRLVDLGALESVEDVFYLTADELLAAGTARETPSLERIEQRKARREHFSGVTPPPKLGTMPAFVPNDTSPFGVAVKKSDGPLPAGGGANENGVHGLPGSGGTVCGPARIINTLGEAGKLQPGDVLITKSTMPPWTPLFGIAAAVVTDMGGVLSHCAVVAREYRIPAVVGTVVATKTFQDGQLVEVDGDAGTVRMVEQIGFS